MEEDLFPLLAAGLGQTVYMVVMSTLFAVLLGLPLGICLVVTSKGHIMEAPSVHKPLDTLINATRSFPDLILIVLLLPLARWLVGTTLGATAAVVPLSMGAAPFVARLVESCLKEVDRGKIEAALAMGASSLQIIYKVLIPESLSSLVRAFTIAVITITSFTATAGAIGAGGLGSLAIRFGYMRYRDDIMIMTVIVLIILVQSMQWAGNRVATVLDKRRQG